MTTATAKQTTVCPKCGGHCTEQPDPAGAYDRCLNCGWNSDRPDDIIEVEGQVEVAAVNGKSPLSCLDCGAHVETNTKGRSPERCPKCRTARKVARTAASRQSRATQPAPAAEGGDDGHLSPGPKGDNDCLPESRASHSDERQGRP